MKQYPFSVTPHGLRDETKYTKYETFKYLKLQVTSYERY